jgi:hypothetical protein
VWNDPQLYLTPSGEAVARFDLGTAAYGPTALGEAATCHRRLAWNRDERNLADLVLENLQSGAVVYVEGRLRAAPSVALQHVGGLWQIVVRDVQLLEAAQGWAGDRFEATRSSTVGAG